MLRGRYSFFDTVDINVASFASPEFALSMLHAPLAVCQTHVDVVSILALDGLDVLVHVVPDTKLELGSISLSSAHDPLIV